MVFYFYIFIVALSALKQPEIACTGKTVLIINSIEPYVAEMKRALK